MVQTEIISIRTGLTSRPLNITGWKIGEYIDDANREGEKKRLIKSPEGKLYTDWLGPDGKHQLILIKETKAEKEKKEEDNKKAELRKQRLEEQKMFDARYETKREIYESGKYSGEQILTDYNSGLNDARLAVREQIGRNNSEGTKEGLSLLIDFIKQNNSIITVRHDKNPTMFVYNKKTGIYENQGETKIKVICENILGKAYKVHYAKEIIERIRIQTYVEQEDVSKIQDPLRITCLNGVINLSTQELEPFSPVPWQFQSIKTNYKPEAECPNFLKFIAEVLPDEDKRNTVQEYIGYSLMRNNRYEKYMLFYGTGENGMTRLLNVIRDCFGRENISSVKPQAMSNGKDPYATADLEKALINIAGEISDATITDTSSIKEAASPEQIRIRNPYEAARTICPFAKNIWSANKPPRINDTSDGFWRRIIPIEFTSKFVDSEIYDRIEGDMEHRVYKKDIDLLDKLTTPEELEGVLAWAVQGLKRLNERKQFSWSQNPQELRLEYNKKADSISAFFDEIITHCVHEAGIVPKQKLYEAYKSYAAHLGVTAASEISLSKHCKKVENLRDERKSASVINGGEGRPWVWLGISEHALADALSKKGVKLVKLFPNTRVSQNTSLELSKTQISLPVFKETGKSLPKSLTEQKASTLDQIRELIMRTSDGQLSAEDIQLNVPDANDEWLERACLLSDLVEMPAGFYRLV